jgi:hypothetical protein
MIRPKEDELIALRRSLIEAEAQIERGEFVTPEESHRDIEELARSLRARRAPKPEN